MTGVTLSLLIPTRERAHTLASTLASALDQSSVDFEVIVSDNAGEDGTREVVERAADPRVRYFNTGRRLSMCDNYEFAFDQAKGDYVLIVGDDDAVIPGALDELLAELRAAPTPTIHMWPLHIYEWPVADLPARVAYLAPERERRELDLAEKARSVIGLGGWKYYELPSPYHSAIPRELMFEIRRRTGRIFHSTQPDVFTAMALPALTDKAVNLGRTITLNGRSAQSNGLGFVNPAARVNIDRFIREYGDYRFHSTLVSDMPPAVNMIPDAVLMARDAFPELYAGTSFDYSAMWAYICRIGFMSHADVIRSRERIARAHPFSIVRFLAYAAVHQAAVVRRKTLDAMTRLRSAQGLTPADIHGFVAGLARRRPVP